MFYYYYFVTKLYFSKSNFSSLTSDAPPKNKKDRCGFVTRSADADKYKRRPFLRPPLDVDVDYLIIVTVPEDSRS